MVIILKHIHAKTTRQNIKDFLASELKGGFLRRSGQIQSIYLLSQRNIRTREVQYHGLVEILPDSVAERVVRKLNAKMIINKRVAINEYKIRDWHNDPRIININVRPKPRKNERRIGDRREQYEEIVSEEQDLLLIGKRAFYMKGW